MKAAFGLAVLLASPLGNLATPAPEKQVNDSVPCLIADISRSGLQSGASDTKQQTETGSGTAYSENKQGIAALMDASGDLKKAERWFEKAARRGYAPAQVNLAMMYLQGWGVAPNDGAAFYWLTLAAQQGHPVGLFDLGQLYLKGCGVRQDYTEAFRLFQQAERKGNAAAQVNLGYMYDEGLGVPRDRAAAAEWYRKAAEAGEVAGEFNLADLYLRGEGLAQSDKVAYEWFEKAALQGYRRAQVMVGTMCAEGRGTTKDLESAYAWIGAAQSEGELDTQQSLAKIERQLPLEALERAKGRARVLAQSPKATTVGLLY